MDNIADIYELSPMQQGMLFHTTYAPNSGVYFEQRSCLLTGNLDTVNFRQAWSQIIDRYPILRTAFYWEDLEKPLQVVFNDAELPWIGEDWSNLTESEQEIKLESWLKSDRYKGFLLDQVPLMRCALFKLEQDKYRFIWSHHHILMDGWCNGILLQEVLAIYQALSQGKDLYLEPPQPYRNYIVWLQEQEVNQARTYWQNALSGFTETTSLSNKRRQRSVLKDTAFLKDSLRIAHKGRGQKELKQDKKDNNYNSVSYIEEKVISLSQEITEQLSTFTAEYRLTLNTIIQGAWALLLSRYCDRNDVMFGATVSGRPANLSGVESIVGLFINTLPVRVKLSPERDLVEWLQEIQQQQIAREEYSYSSLVDIQKWSSFNSKQALFYSLVIFENYPISLADFLQNSNADFTITDLQGFEKTNYPLTLYIIPRKQLTFKISYDTNYFNLKEIEKIGDRLILLLTNFVRSPDRKLTNISILSTSELERIHNKSDRVDYNTDLLLPQLFETVAAEKQGSEGSRGSKPRRLALKDATTPDAPGTREKMALIADDKSFTYAELNERVNQLAHYLKSQGITNNCLVGIYLTRDSDLIISLLAVLKTGAAYVPLDPSYPNERISYIINRAEIFHLITKQNIDLKTFDINHKLSVINLETERENIQRQSTENPKIGINPQDLAYVIYTSGSTGKPKGVAVQHNSLLNFLYSMKEQPGITEADKLLAITTISFDIAALEIYLPLITGATLVLANRENTIDADLLSRKIAKNNITIMQATPATWQMLVANKWQGKQDFKILCGGETLTQKLARELFTKCQKIWNLYGPTETTIWSAAYKFEPDNNSELNTVPIGKATANTEFYILDSQLNPVPEGRSGELYIAGAGLARGYLNSPDLTAERFIPNPFMSRGSRGEKPITHPSGAEHSLAPVGDAGSPLYPLPFILYKTGDRVRQLPSGDLEYLGRLDNQIKLRGYRIELGEIEAVLDRYPHVQNSVVIANDESLVAYIILDSPSATSAIRQFLANKLPGYMIPGNIIQLESFPLTPNGKIDRQALSSIENNDNRDEQSSAVIFQTPTEEILLGIWTEILNRANITTNDNFFELGGHSLLATRVVSQIRQIFSMEFPLRDLFEYPTIKDLALVIECAQKNSTKNPVDIEIVSREGDLPLSFAQQRQWFLHQLEPNNPWYNLSTAVKIIGSLDIARLQQCLDFLVERQEILRTAFLTVEGKPKLIINDAAKIDLLVVDLSSLPKADQHQQIRQLQIDDARQPFALDKCPLMRVKLLTIDSNEQILLLSLHHIIADGWSMGVLVEEIVGLYQAFNPPSHPTLASDPASPSGARECASRGISQSPPYLGDLGGNNLSFSIQYVDYAAWQRKYLQGEVLDRQVKYWQEKLADAPEISSIATDFPRKPQSNYESAAYNFQINHRLTKSLKQIGRSNSGTLFITLFSALALLLHRYTDNDDLVIGTPIANRDRAEIEGLIGFFANTLALRLDLTDNPSFTELLARARETALGAYSHQDLPFEQLIDKLQLERSLSYSPLFQVMLVLEEQIDKTVKVEESERPRLTKTGLPLTSLTWKPLERVTTQAKFELTFLLKETEKGLQGSIEYNKALFSTDTIHRLAGHFRTLLIAIADNPQAKISNLSILSKSEFKQVINKFNHSNNVAINSCINELFESQANQTPDAVAVVNGTSAITYQELNHRSNNWAHYLQSLGVKSETRVGIMCDRQIDTIITLLAILKAGGCYVPLDPNYPQERLNWMLEDTQLKILLTQTKYIEKLSNSNLTLINLDCPPVPQSPTHAAKAFVPVSQSPAYPNNLAYITYTSGSTGRPKGVAIPHSGVIRLVKDPNYVELNTDTKMLQAAPISFDASTFEIWGALLNGGRVIILSNPVPSLAELAETIVKYKINTLWLTAGLFHLMIDEQIDSFGDVRQLLAGGDVLSSSHIQKFLEAHPQSSLINGYGPTETTTFACCYPMQDTEIDSNRSIIGDPISNTQLYILDKYLNPLPVGVPGELHIAGSGLARGYLNHSELTAEKFIPNPFSLNNSSPASSATCGSSLCPAPLLYKTGDLVKYLPSGKIEYLSRIDNQVKIRGFRVELGEIETALSQLENIKDNIVLVKENNKENKQLIAFVIANNLANKQEDRWRKCLKNKLPDYLIPNLFIICESFSLTANGKIDREALLERDIVRPPVAKNSTPAQTELEVKLTQIWSEILNLETINANSNFFSLGGDSILAIQIVSKANQAGIKITPRQLFENQTIAELANVAKTDITTTAEQGLITGSIPITPIQKWFFGLNLANVNHFNQSVLLKTKQHLDLNILQSALKQLLTHHDVLRTKFAQTDNGWEQYNCALIEEIKIEQINLSDLSIQEQTKAITQASDSLQASLDITNNLLAIAYFNLGKLDNDNRLLIIIHHLLIDGVSWRILLEDLQTVYHQIANSKTIQLPDKTTSYQQWSDFLQKYTKSSLKMSLNYWLKQDKYSDYSLLLNSKSKQNSTENNRQSIKTTLDREYTKALLKDVNQTYNTQINDLLLTALIKTFISYTNRLYLLIDLESQGRTQIETDLDISRTVGWFTNIYPVLLDLCNTNTQDLAENIKTIKEQLRQAQQYSFDFGVIRFLQSDRQIEQLPIPLISFNYLGRLDNLQSAASLFQLAQESTGAVSAVENRASHRIAINSSVIDSKLQIDWNYDRDCDREQTIIDLAENYIAHLQQIIDHCQNTTGSYTPSDFSLAEIEQNTIESIANIVDFNG
ncbi:MAG: amino acid adenylation domain-containing protein [Cyanobacteria bacterium P01_G01_bin.67]